MRSSSEHMDAEAVLKPYRKQIDAIDDRIVALLAERFGVIREVADLKAQKGIPSVLPDRVNEVIERAVTRAAFSGLDAGFVRALYKTMIKHAHDIEDRAKRDRLTADLRK